MEKKKYSRKEILIDKNLQMKMVLLVTVPTLLMIFTMFSCFFYLFDNLLSLDVSFEVMNQIIFVKNNIYLIAFAISIIVLNIIIPLAFVFSHRIAGPMHNLFNSLNEFNNGVKAAPIYFRKNDFFMEINEEFNKFVDNAKEKNRS